MKKQLTKIDRSAAKLLPGAMALAATAASSQAAIVQITLTGNKISTTGGNTLYADLTVDGVEDVFLGAWSIYNEGVWALINSAMMLARFSTYSDTYAVVAKSNWGFGSPGYGGGTVGQAPYSATALNAATFSDSRVNGGAATDGWVQVRSTVGGGSYEVELTRLIFDDSSTTRPAFTEIPGTQTEWSAVPEPSSLGLLALGAGGLLLRRSRAKQAA